MTLRRILATAIVFVSAWNMPVVAGEVVVSAASSLTNAFKEMASHYEKDHADTKVVPSFAASDVLLQQIIHGAPADIFASADQKAMDKAAEAGVIDSGSRTNFVRNEIVLIVPADDKHGITSLADLSNSAITRVAFGNPATVPVGATLRPRWKRQVIGAW